MKETHNYTQILKALQIPHQVHFWTFSYNYIDLCGNRYKYSRVNVHYNLIQFFDDGRECVRVEWDDDNNISDLIAISKMPDIRMSCSAAFEDNVTGHKTAEYFATVCNDRPFTYRKYLRDNGAWILLN